MSKRIMVIDDASAIRQVVKHVLSSQGYDLVEAVDGMDALKKLDGQNIDLFVCDVNMPNMDGITLLEKVKKDDQYASYRFAPFIIDRKSVV